MIIPNKGQTSDWNVFWPTATNVAPTTCLLCDKKLEKPKAKGKLLGYINGQPLVASHDTQWRVDCKCGACYVWSWPNVYIQTHRYMELLMHRFDNGNLLKPFDVI